MPSMINSAPISSFPAILLAVGNYRSYKRSVHGTFGLFKCSSQSRFHLSITLHSLDNIFISLPFSNFIPDVGASPVRLRCAGVRRAGLPARGRHHGYGSLRRALVERRNRQSERTIPSNIRGALPFIRYKYFYYFLLYKYYIFLMFNWGKSRIERGIRNKREREHKRIKKPIRTRCKDREWMRLERKRKRVSARKKERSQRTDVH